MSNRKMKVTLYYFVDHDSVVLHSGLVVKYCELENGALKQTEYFFKPFGFSAILDYDNRPEISFIGNIEVKEISTLNHIIMTTEKSSGANFLCWDWTKCVIEQISQIYCESEEQKIGIKQNLAEAIEKHQIMIRESLYLQAFNTVR